MTLGKEKINLKGIDLVKIENYEHDGSGVLTPFTTVETYRITKLGNEREIECKSFSSDIETDMKELNKIKRQCKLKNIEIEYENMEF